MVQLGRCQFVRGAALAAIGSAAPPMVAIADDRTIYSELLPAVAPAPSLPPPSLPPQTVMTLPPPLAAPLPNGVSQPAPPVPPSHPASPPAPATPTSITTLKARRKAFGGLAEVLVGDDGFEYAVLPASSVDTAPAWLRPSLKSVRVQQRRLSDTEIFTASLVAGALAEVAKVTLLHPLDTVKTRLQTRAKAESRLNAAFRALDADGSGDVTLDEFVLALERSGIDVEARGNGPGGLPMPVVRSLFQRYATSGGDTVSYSEFASNFWSREGSAIADGIWDENADADDFEFGIGAADDNRAGERGEGFALDGLVAQLGWRDVSVVRKPWAGLTPALLTAAPQAGAFAGTRDLLRRELLGVSASVSWLDSKQSALLAIVAANLAYWLIRAPSDVVKQRRQTGRATARGAVAYVRDGLSAYPVSVLTDLPAILCRTSLYSYWKSSLGSGAAPLAQTEAATVAIAIAVAAITTPLDVLRTTTLQGQLNDTRGKARPVAAIASAVRTLRARVESDGASVLFAGMVPRVLWNGIVVGAATPLKSLGFYLARDGVVLLELFDETTRTTAESITIG